MKIGIIGLAGSGKDTFGEFLLGALEKEYNRVYDSYVPWMIEKFAAPLKAAAAHVFGQNFDDREVKEVPQHIDTAMLIRMGEALLLLANRLGMRGQLDALVGLHGALIAKRLSISPREYQQIVGTEIVRAVKDSAFRDRLADMDNIICTDCRFLNEVPVFDYTLLITRPGISPVAAHSSEKLAAELTLQATTGSLPLFITQTVPNTKDKHWLRHLAGHAARRILTTQQLEDERNA